MLKKQVLDNKNKKKPVRAKKLDLKLKNCIDNSNVKKMLPLLRKFSSLLF